MYNVQKEKEQCVLVLAAGRIFVMAVSSPVYYTQTTNLILGKRSLPVTRGSPDGIAGILGLITALKLIYLLLLWHFMDIDLLVPRTMVILM